MFTFAKQLGVVSLSGMVALSFMVPAAQAQRRGGMAARPMSQPRPIVQTQRPGGIAARPMSRPIVQRPGGIAARPVSRPKPVVPRPGGVAARPSSQPKPLVQAQRPGAMPATLATRPGLPGKPTPGSLQSSNPSPIFLPPQIDGTPFRCWDRDCCWDRDRCWDRDCWWRHCRHYWPYDQRTDNNTNNNNSGGGSSSSSSSGGSSSGGSDDGGSALRTYADLLRQQQAEAERLRRELSEKRRRDSDEKESDRTPRGGSAQALPSPNRAPVAEIRSAKALNDILD